MYYFFSHLLQPFPVAYLLTALALANLWRGRMESRRRLLLLTVPFVLFTLVCLPVVAHLALGSLEWQYPPMDQRPDDVEAIVVLSGSMTPPDEVQKKAVLGTTTQDRCIHAARLYHQGKPCLVVATGGKVHPDTPGPPTAEVMRDFLLELGVAENNILVEGQSRSTYENAVRTKQLLQERGINKILLVTEVVHMRRSESCFLAEGFEVIPSPCRYRATRMRWSFFKFLPNPVAAKHVQEAAHEWLGMLWYSLKGRT